MIISDYAIKPFLKPFGIFFKAPFHANKVGPYSMTCAISLEMTHRMI